MQGDCREEDIIKQTMRFKMLLVLWVQFCNAFQSLIVPIIWHAKQIFQAPIPRSVHAQNKDNILFNHYAVVRLDIFLCPGQEQNLLLSKKQSEQKFRSPDSV